MCRGWAPNRRGFGTTAVASSPRSPSRRRVCGEVRAGETMAAGAFTGRLVLTTSADVPEVVVPVSGERPRP